MAAPTLDLRDVEAFALRQLVKGVDIGELRAAFEDARAGASSPEDVDRINEMLVDALTLHDARTVSMRREAQLAALCDTAVDLAELRELDEVLRALCQRVRSLLGTDAAYITLLDHERGDTFIRMTDGIVSEGFRVMRLPLGTGLGGVVAQSGTSATTEDYSVDARLVHTETLDRLVAAEGLRGIAGSPLRRGQEVLGVVLTGSRYPRRFGPSELALLESLATLAAIAIENARLFLETRRTCEELSHANEAVRAHTAWLERSAEDHDRLTRFTLEGAGVDELAGAIADVLGGSVVWRAAGDGGPSPSVEQEAGHTAAVPVTVGDENLGTLRLTRDAPITPNALHFLERGSLLVARVVLNERARAEVEQRLAGEVVEELCLGGPTSLEPATRRAAQLGVDLGHDFVVVVASPPASAVRWSRLRAARAAADQGGLMGAVDGLIVGVVPGDRARAIADEWRRRLTGAGGEEPTIGAAGPARGATGIRTAYREALNTHRLLLALDRSGSAATADDVGALGLLLSRSRPGELRAFVADRLRRLDDYEARDGGKLIETLEAYLERNGHLADSARALHVHVNTLYRRLERIDELLGPEWRAADRRLDLHLALRLRRLMDRLDVVRA